LKGVTQNCNAQRHSTDTYSVQFVMSVRDSATRCHCNAIAYRHSREDA